MAGTEELLARLSQLENSYNADKRAAKENQFFSTYGSRFSNNRGLGLAILNELDARGIDTSAADEAVQEILDTLRTECNEILELTKEANEAAIQNAQKVETIANVVDQAVASNPDTEGINNTDSVGLEAPVPPEMPPVVNSLDPNAEFNPEDVGQEPAAPAEPAPEGQEPAPAEQAPAEQAPVPPEEPPAETDVTSDMRMKRIKGMKDRWGKVHQKKSSYKPSKGILSACGGDR